MQSQFEYNGTIYEVRVKNGLDDLEQYTLQLVILEHLGISADEVSSVIRTRLAIYVSALMRTTVTEGDRPDWLISYTSPDALICASWDAFWGWVADGNSAFIDGWWQADKATRPNA